VVRCAVSCERSFEKGESARQKVGLGVDPEPI
jgi:hypothetical protein